MYVCMHGYIIGFIIVRWKSVHPENVLYVLIDYYDYLHFRL